MKCTLKPSAKTWRFLNYLIKPGPCRQRLIQVLSKHQRKSTVWEVEVLCAGWTIITHDEEFYLAPCVWLDPA